MNNGIVLIVEDKDEFRKIYGDRLRSAGYVVVDASDGNQALEVLRSQKIDLVITDINMPHKDGYELITDMKADEKLKAIPVMIMTVFDEPDHLKKAVDLGAADYLVKGMNTPNMVKEKVGALIKKGIKN